jgi:glutathione reductase (NADPH)
VGKPELDWKMFMEKKRKELQRLNGVYGGILDRANVRTIEGRAKLLDAHTVEVNGETYTSKYICIAVGGTPTMIGIPGEHRT